MYSPGGIRGGGRAAVRHKLAKICRIRSMGGLVRERKCGLVASGNYCGQCVGEPFLSKADFPDYFVCRYGELGEGKGVGEANKR